jgi:hypothetical protein
MYHKAVASLCKLYLYRYKFRVGLNIRWRMLEVRTDRWVAWAKVVSTLNHGADSDDQRH